MAKFLRKAWPHLLVLGIAVIFVLIAPSVYMRYFVTKGKPISLELPPETRQVQYNIEKLNAYDEQGTYLLQGWAFLTLDKAIPSGEYEREVVLFSGTGYQIYPAEITTRTDVQDFFSDLGMNLSLSGFQALFAKDTIALGTYNIGLVFKHVSNGTTLLVRTNRCITRTPNHLLLEVTNSSQCNVLIAQRQGMPVQTTGGLPPATSQVKFWVDGLKTYNSDAIYKLFGWVFLTVDPQIPAGDYDRQVVLISETQNLFFLADPAVRPDVQEYFSNLGMDLTQAGFSALIARDALESGTYCIGIILKHTGSSESYFVNTDRCLTRTTDNNLILEERGSGNCCTSVTVPVAAEVEQTPEANDQLPAETTEPSTGQPVETNVQLPTETTDAKWWVEGLDAQENDVYRLWGWAFPTMDTTLPSGTYKREVVLTSGSKNLIFSAVTSLREDVQNKFSNLGMDVSLSGFSALIAKNALELGIYQVGLIFKNPSDDTDWYVNVNRCLTNTAKMLVLEKNGSTICSSTSP
jgi:hypothetical protein